MTNLLRSGIDVSVIDTPTTKNTPLHWAATFGSAVTVQILLEQFGADPNTLNSTGITPLHDAVTRGDINIVKVLIKFGANPTLKSVKEKDPIDIAQEKNLSEVVKVLRSSSYLHNGLSVASAASEAVEATNTSRSSHVEERNRAELPVLEVSK